METPGFRDAGLPAAMLTSALSSGLMTRPLVAQVVF